MDCSPLLVMKHLAMLVHSCGYKYQLDTQLFSNLSQYSQSTVVEICKQDLYTLKGGNPTVMAFINQ